MRSKHRDPALQRRANIEQFNPYGNQQQLFLAKVIAVHPDTGMVDVALDGTPHQGGFYRNVPVLSWSYATQTGQAYLPSNIKLASPIPSSVGEYDQPIPSGEQDVWCVCGHLNGKAQRPVCLGFLSPYTSQIHTKDAGYEIKLHESGVYSTTTPNGKVQIGLPDGSTIIIGTDTTPVDLTSQNAKWKPHTTNQNYSLTLNIKGDITLNASGDIYIGSTHGGGTPIARQGDPVSVSTTTGVGTITGGSSKVFSG